jgi:sugar phosphate isomerase/epimerase
MIQLGGPVFVGTDDLRAWAGEHRRLGYTAAYCPPVGPDDTDMLAGLADATTDHGLTLAEVGLWRNLISPNEAQRRENIARAREQLSIAEKVGARCCVTFAGTRGGDKPWGPHEDNFSAETFDLIVETVREIIDEVRPSVAKFALEMMQTCPPDSAENYLELIKAIDRPAFGVHLDPVNLLMRPRDCYDSGRTIEHCFDVLGPWIVSCHAKDLCVEHGLALHLNECIPGTGLLDYPTYVRRLRKLGRSIPLMLEHLDGPEQYDQARKYVQGVIDQAAAS